MVQPATSRAGHGYLVWHQRARGDHFAREEHGRVEERVQKGQK